MSDNQPAQEFLKEAVYLVDSSSYIFRAYYAIRAPLMAPDGTPTHATHGFLQMLGTLKKEYGAKNIVFVWDRKEKGLRHDLYPKYKANRSAPPEDLSLQIENTRKTLEYLGFIQLDSPGFEADDVLASLVRKYPERNFVIVTADKDLLQLVGDNCWCLDTFKGKYSHRQEAFEKFGVSPEKIADVQALCGDSVDNVPGAPGIGPKTATQLINDFGDLEKVIEVALARHGGAKSEKDSLSGKRVESIAGAVDLIRVSKKLVSLFETVNCSIDFSKPLMAPVQVDLLRQWGIQMGFQKLLAQWSQSGLLNQLSSEDSVADSTATESVADSNFKVDVVTLQSLEELRKVLSQARRFTRMAFDTETFDLRCRQAHQTVGLSFCFELPRAYYVPLRHVTGNQLNPETVFQELFNFWSDSSSSLTEVVFQNAKFDLHVLQGEGIQLPARLQVQDTMVASFVLDPSSSHGMDALALRHLSYAPQSFKALLGDAKSIAEVSIEDTAFYAAEDAAVTLALWDKLSAALCESKLMGVYEHLDRPLVQILQRMERCGVLMDREKLGKLSLVFRDELNALNLEVVQLLKSQGLELEEDLNLSSPKQVASILFEKLRLPILKKGKTGPSTDVKVLEELAHLHPFPGLLLKIRELSKLLSTYVDAFPQMLDVETDRMHTDFSQIIAATGRLSSSHPNLQNIPIRTERGRRMREAFVAGPGKKLIGADYSQVELRVLAHMSQDPALIQAFLDESDIHSRTAALILKKSELEVSSDDRRMAKTINFGIVYGQSAFGLAKTLKISQAEAKTFIEGYFQTYPCIRSYMDAAIAEAKRDAQVTTLSGRRRPLPEIRSKNGVLRQLAERMAINSPIQGSAADLMKAAMIEVAKNLEQEFPEASLLLQVHDELILEAPAEIASQVAQRLKDWMENPALLKDFGLEHLRVPMKVEVAVGDSWGDI